jgi:hypothetical protein
MRKKNKKIVEGKTPIRNLIGELFSKAGYKVKIDSFEDKSGSWIEISNEKSPHVRLTIDFDDEGVNLEGFSVWKDVWGIIDEKKIM